MKKNKYKQKNLQKKQQFKIDKNNSHKNKQQCSQDSQNQISDKNQKELFINNKLQNKKMEQQQQKRLNEQNNNDNNNSNNESGQIKSYQQSKIKFQSKIKAYIDGYCNKNDNQQYFFKKSDQRSYDIDNSVDQLNKRQFQYKGKENESQKDEKNKQYQQNTDQIQKGQNLDKKNNFNSFDSHIKAYSQEFFYDPQNDQNWLQKFKNQYKLPKIIRKQSEKSQKSEKNNDFIIKKHVNRKKQFLKFLRAKNRQNKSTKNIVECKVMKSQIFRKQQFQEQNVMDSTLGLNSSQISSSQFKMNSNNYGSQNRIDMFYREQNAQYQQKLNNNYSIEYTDKNINMHARYNHQEQIPLKQQQQFDQKLQKSQSSNQNNEHNHQNSQQESKNKSVEQWVNVLIALNTKSNFLQKFNRYCQKEHSFFKQKQSLINEKSKINIFSILQKNLQELEQLRNFQLFSQFQFQIQDYLCMLQNYQEKDQQQYLINEIYFQKQKNI